ncbi:MAG: 16S rRNA (uracil(1498)-N(3))-methyltransferase [Alphaproteobacteria bacterium]|nr:16S rRNA (uracil(1498)-N(3))-methyltransferase [Alphaproteobacteria bacterium]
MQGAKPRLRLFVELPLAAGLTIPLSPEQAHRALAVMRMAQGEPVVLFNGCDGEWRGGLMPAGRRAAAVTLSRPLRPQAAEPDLWLAFAPLDGPHTALLVEKATELGVARLLPVLTTRTQGRSFNAGRLAARALAAAEQCERLTVPEIAALQPFDRFLAGWPGARPLLVGDETGVGRPLAEVAAGLAAGVAGGLALLTGPEGGFVAAELDGLASRPFVTRVHMGPRILRAETAAIAGLAILQALAGDWRDRGSFRGGNE